MNETAKESWDYGGAYELWVGRWSRSIAEEFIEWLAVSPWRTWGDVGCGTGALVERLASLQPPTAQSP
jgi:ubiquinone/menaquinone biosynthesis C-methylase UbiE